MLAAASSSSLVVPGRRVPQVGVYVLVGGSGPDPLKRHIGDQHGLYQNGYLWWAAQTGLGYPAWCRSHGFDGMWVQQPGGSVDPDFEGDSFLACRDSADPNLQRLHTEFAAAIGPHVSPGFPIIAYVGNFYRSFQPTDWPSMADGPWAARVADAVAPIDAAGCILGQDAATPTMATAPERRYVAWLNARAEVGKFSMLEPDMTEETRVILPRMFEGTTQSYLDGGQSVSALQSNKRMICMGNAEPVGGTAAERRDIMCKWAWMASVVMGRWAFVSSHHIFADDTKESVLARGAALWAQSPEEVVVW